MEVVVRSLAGLRWVRGLIFAAPNWWPAKTVPWPNRPTATPMSATLWTVLLERAILPEWELTPPPIDLGGHQQKLVFVSRAQGSGLEDTEVIPRDTT